MPYAKGTKEFYHYQVVGMHMAIYVSILEKIRVPIRMIGIPSVLTFIPKCLHKSTYTYFILKMIEVYSPFGIWNVFLYSINTDKNLK